MGIDYSGGMVVGAHAEVVSYDEDKFDDIYDFVEEHGMDTYSQWFDAGEEGMIIGFSMKNIDPLSPEFENWVTEVKEAAEKFKIITGSDVELIGTQNIY